MDTARAKFRKIFGEINHLKEDISWTNGLSSLAGFLAWNPEYLIGMSKRKFIHHIVKLAYEPIMQGKPIEEIGDYVRAMLEAEMKVNEQYERYSQKTRGICNAREALRRIRYFSEDYLNKEFDIFLSLASDNYLDELYTQFINLNRGGHWTAIGNSHLFEFSVEIKRMAMDNLAYNHEAKLLIANELKLNGGKNQDQILKYAFLLKSLIEKNFIDPQTQLVLLFIAGKNELYEKHSLIDKEIAYCQKTAKDLNYLLDKEVISIAKNMTLANLSWKQIIEFNENYLASHTLCQVEQKLIAGFNQSLKEKSFIYLT